MQKPIKLRTVELFAGTKSFSKIAQSFGHNTFTFDNEQKLDPDCVMDVMKWGGGKTKLRCALGIATLHDVFCSIHSSLLGKRQTEERQGAVRHRYA